MKQYGEGSNRNTFKQPEASKSSILFLSSDRLRPQPGRQPAIDCPRLTRITTVPMDGNLTSNLRNQCVFPRSRVHQS